MKLAVYCTGGTELGFGHFFRSKAFVKNALSEFNVRIFPVIKAEDKHIFNDLGDIASPCQNEREALQEILDFDADTIIFDSIYCSTEFIKSIRSNTKRCISISPVFNQMKMMDYLFTRNSDTPSIGNVKIFKGFEYIVFNENCEIIPDDVYLHNLSRNYLTVGISMGGGDAPNKTLRVLQSISKLKAPCTFWVLLGEGYQHSFQDLVDSIRRDSNHEIILAKTNRSMWNVLSNCSVAIFAGGLTTLEAVYAGLPSLNLFDKETQLNATGRKLFDLGAAKNLGIFGDDSLKGVCNYLVDFYGDKSALLEIRNRSRGLIDKNGAKRICDVIKKLND